MRVVGPRYLLAACALSCSTPQSKDPPTDASADAADAVADVYDHESGLTCSSSTRCASIRDCVAGGGVQGCWTCELGCCIPVARTTDPQKACDAGSACFVSACDGEGSCTFPHPARDGTPCGATCSGTAVLTTSSCQGGQCSGIPSSIVGCADRCYGDYTGCNICDTTGCVASCDPIAHDDRCFP